MSKAPPDQPLVVNGWTLFTHPVFLQQIDTLIGKVEKLKRDNPAEYRSKNATKRLAAIAKLAFQEIPQDPGRPVYRQGDTLGPDQKHWFRAKFFQQYRLFFRFHSKSKIIVLAWVNDEQTKRAYDSDSDAYRVFQKMIAAGHPPDAWEQLLQEAQRASKQWGKLEKRLSDIVK